MTDTITGIFSQHLPCVPSNTAGDFANGMHAYHTAFKALRDSAMNYEGLPDYETSSYIMQVPCDQFWPYTPHFRKVVALAIEDLFKTRITSLGASPCTMAQALVFVDDQRNRWIVRVEESALDDKLVKIHMHFPRSNSLTVAFGQRVPAEQLIDTAFLKEKNLAIVTEDIQPLMGRAEK